MKKRVKIILLIIAVLAVGGFSVFSYFQPLALETETLTESRGEISFTETGAVTDNGKIQIYPLVSGEVLSITVSKGDYVKKGDVLAILNNTDVTLQLVQTKAMLMAYEAQRDSALTEINKGTGSVNDQMSVQQGVIEQAKLIWDKSIQDMMKYRELYDAGYISVSEYNELEFLVENNEIAYNQSLDQMEVIKSAKEGNLSQSTKAYYDAMIESTQAGVDALENILLHHSIVSPADGMIDEIYIDDTNVATSVSPAFVIQGNDDQEVEVYVSTRDIDSVEVEDEVTLILDRRSGDIEIKGKVTQIANNATVMVSALGVEERKVLVTVEPIDNEILLAGYDVDVKFIVYSANDKVIVPNSAIYEVDEKDMVMVIRDGKTEELEITLGYELTGKTIVEEGLIDGDILVTDLDAKGLKAGIRAASSNE